MYTQNPNLIGLPAQTLVGLSQNPWQGLAAGYQVGNTLYEQDRQRGLEQDLSQAFDPSTGQMDWGKAIAAVMKRDPTTGYKLLQQKRLEEQQQAGLQAALSGDYTPEERQVLLGYGTQGDWGKGVAKVGELRVARAQADYARGQELVNVQRPDGSVVQIPRSQLTPSPPAQPIPAGQPAPSAQPIPAGQPAPSAPPIPSAPAPVKGKGNLFDRYQQAPWFSDAVAIANTFKLDLPSFLALIHQESGGDPKAVGTSGEVGLTQLMPATAQRFGVTDRSNPTQSLMGGAKYLRYLLDRYNGDYTKALTAYNMGEGNVDKGASNNYAAQVAANAAQFRTVPATSGVQVAQAGGTAGGLGVDLTQGIPVKRAPAVELQEQEETKQPYQIAAEKRAEQQRIAADQRRAAQEQENYQRTEPERLFQRANQLRDEYNKLTGPLATQGQAYGDILNAAKDSLLGKGNVGETDINMLYAYMKLLDPNSVVREGEVQMPAAARSTVEAIQLKLDRLAKGGALVPVEREQMVREAYKRYDNAMTIAGKVQQRYTTLAKGANVTPDAAGLYDLRSSFGLPSADDFLTQLKNPAPAPAGTAPAPAPAPAPVQSQSPPSTGKIVTQQQLEAQAKRLGITPENARKSLEQQGFVIQ